MNEFWGLSESQILSAYGLALAAAIVWARLVRERFVARDVRPAAPELTSEELGYLAGGRRRAVETSIAGMVRRGALRAGPNGALEPTGVRAARPLDAVVLTQVAQNHAAGPKDVVSALTGHDAVRAVGDRLVRLGLLVDRAALRRQLRRAVLPILLLDTFGLLHWVQLIATNSPIGWLTVALALTAVSAAIVTRPPDSARTPLGNRVLAEASRRVAAGNAADHGPLGVPWSAARTVALSGLGGYPDPAVRTSLFRPTDEPEHGGAAHLSPSVPNYGR